MQIQKLRAIIQRHAAGDRSPHLLAALDAAAWDCFHDPWEVRPASAQDPVREALASVDDLDEPELFLHADPEDLGKPGLPSPAIIEKLTAFMVVNHWEHHWDAGGQLVAVPRMRGIDGRDLTLRLVVERDDEDLYFLLSSAWGVPAAAHAEARLLCDKWNHSGRRLAACLDPDPLGGPPRLQLEALLTMPADVTLPALVKFLDACVRSARDFWELARLEAERWPR